MLDENKPRSDTDKENIAWASYITNVDRCDMHGIDKDRISNELDRLSPHLFGKQLEVFLTDVTIENAPPIAEEKDLSAKRSREGSRATSCVLNNRSDVRAALAKQRPRLRVISLVRKHLKANFRVDRDSLLELMQGHKVSPSFLDILFGFRDTASPAEKGYGIWSSGKLNSECQLISYQLRYMERNPCGHGSKWSEQQIGVYHLLHHRDDCDVVFLLHAKLDCKVKTLLHAERDGSDAALHSSLKDPFAIHTLIFSSFLHEWRWYLDNIAHECRALEDRCMTIELNAVATRLSFEDLRHVRNIESQLLTAVTVLEATTVTLKEVVDALVSWRVAYMSNTPKAENRESFGNEVALRDLIRRCECFIRSANEVQKRNDKLIQLTTDSFILSNQSTAEKINHTVRVVTIITLVYLPTQFVATFFGSNFVIFNAETGMIQMSKATWMFIVIAMPLTVLTVFVWWYISRAKAKDLRRERDQNRLVPAEDIA